jgi:hypothetical protein
MLNYQNRWQKNKALLKEYQENCSKIQVDIRNYDRTKADLISYEIKRKIINKIVFDYWRHL